MHYLLTEKQINKMQVDNAKELDVATPMYNQIQYSNNHAKISGSLWKFHKDHSHANIINSESFKFKARTTERTLAGGNT